MKTLPLRVLAPERTFFDGACTSLTVPSIDGMYGLMAQHEDIVLAIVPGKLTLRDADGVEQIAAVSEGVLKMEHGEALVLVDTIERPEEIDLHRAEEMAAEARAELKAKRSAQEQAIANARIARAISRIHVKHDGKSMRKRKFAPQGANFLISPPIFARFCTLFVLKVEKKEGKSMEMSARKPLLPRRVLDLPIDALRPNPNQPRIEFDEASLRSLSDSIRRYGILQPLTVRRTDEGYELIAGERRLRAAKLAGLREVPCLLARSSEEESALLALIENLQRRDLHYLEEAAAIARLIATYGLSQEQAAERLGKSQSAIANKLRLLRLSPDCVRLLREHDLSERHARALLRLTDEEDRLKALQVIAARGYNVAQSEAYIEELLKLKQKTPPPRLPTYIVKDVRIFLNTIRHSLGLMQRAGVEADMQREDTDDGILLTIRIPKRAKEAG